MKLISMSTEKAFCEMYKKYQPRLYLFVCRYVKDKDIANDIIQELFIRLWMKRGSLQLETIESYIYSIVRNLIKDHLDQLSKSKKLQEQFFNQMNNSRATEKIEIEDHKDNVNIFDGIKQLPPKRRRVLELVKFEALTYEEVAEYLGISKSTVRLQMIASLKFLRHWYIKKNKV